MTPYRFQLSLDSSNAAVNMERFAHNHDVSGYSYHMPFQPQHWQCVSLERSHQILLGRSRKLHKYQRFISGFT